MLVIAALLVGAIVPVQTAINTRFRESVGSPIVAGFFSLVLLQSWGSRKTGVK